MECRSGCGACCIAPSISSSIPGMPDGKPPGVSCVHLLDDFSCAIFNDPKRPLVCGRFKAESAICGINRLEALKNLENLETGIFDIVK